MRIKKNLKQIEYNGIQCFEKVHYRSNCYDNELSIYKRNLSCVPRLIHHDEANLTLIVEYLEGKTLQEIESPDFSLMAMLFGELHQTEQNGERVLCHLDTNLTNYLVRDSDQQYFMIDFEYSTLDYRETDIIRFLTYWSFLYSATKYEAILNEFYTNYPALDKLNINRYKKTANETFIEFDKPKWKFGKNEMVSN